MKNLLIYGATGYTGRMAAQRAKDLGLPVTIAGRDATRLANFSSELGVEHRAFSLEEEPAMEAALAEASVILNCAGPYLRTAKPLMKAALRNGVHYLDVAAELDSYRLAEQLDQEAKAAGIMLMPGSGGSVAMLGGLAAYGMQHIPHPKKISIALHVSGSMSRGSAISARENLTTECLSRENGVLTSRKPEDNRYFDFGSGPVECFPVTLPDLITLWRSAGAPDIETFVHVSGSAFPTGDLATIPDGPTEEERKANRYQASIEITGSKGEVRRATLDTVNGYTFTPIAAAEAARRVLDGAVIPGFQTPVQVFGLEFVKSIAVTQFHDI